MRKSMTLIFFSVLLVLVLIGCKEEPISYTLLFETNGGSLCEAITFDEREQLILPTDPTKEGYTFRGWFMDANLSVMFTVDQLLASEFKTLTLHAKWSLADSDVTFLLKHIYQLALDSNAFEGTYEAWLETLRGPQGLPGEKGESGHTPYIGENGNWFIDQIDTKVFAGYYYPDIPTTGEFTFAVNSDGKSYYILSYTGLDRYVNIPKYHLGYPVTSIGPSVFKNNDVIVSVFISNFIVDIEEHAFSGAINLKNVIMEEGSVLKTIGDYAFHEAISLSSIYIPHTLTYIGEYAFYNAQSLESATIEEGSQLTFIGRYAFADAIALTDIFIPKGVTEIKEFTFYRTVSLQSVTFEEQSELKHIRNYAFFGNSSLPQINLPEGLEDIGEGAFQSQWGLIAIHIPASVTEIGRYAFSGAYNLTTVTFADNSQLTGIRDRVFYLTASLESITIPANVTWIGEYAFNDSGIETVHFETGSKLKSIGRDAFSECDNLTIIRIPSGVTTIASYAFYSTYNLTTVYIPISVTYIGVSAFRGSMNLTICVEAFSKPDMWDVNWNSSNRPVHWGYIWM